MTDLKKVVRTAAEALLDKKADDLRIIKVDKVTNLAEYFIVCSGTSSTRIKTLADFVEVTLEEKYGEKPLHREGYIEGNWVLIDYGVIIVHVFNSKTREYYALEKLWEKGENIAVEDL